MPHDLFGDVVARPQAAGPRRSPLVVASVGVHVVLIAGFMIASVVAPAALPFPNPFGRDPVNVHLVDIPLPKPPDDIRKPEPTVHPNVTTTGPTLGDPADNRIGAPTEAPTGISPDTGIGGGGGGDIGEPGGEPVAPLPQANRDKVEPPPPAAPVRLHSGIRAPRRLNEIAPAYPAIARDAHVEGVVILEATIDAGGAVQTARVLRSIPLLDEAALSAVRQWQFEPALLNGQPVAVIMTVTVKFTLNR